MLRSGMGAARARSAAPAAARIPADAVAVAGFCGAVAGGSRAGDVVVASEVRGPAGVTTCASGPVVAALAALGTERVHVGPVASIEHLVRGAERGVLAGEGALAVDMESAWLAPAAAGRPFAVLRVVLDTPARELHRPLATLAGGARGLAGLATGGARAGALGSGVRPARRAHGDGAFPQPTLACGSQFGLGLAAPSGPIARYCRRCGQRVVAAKRSQRRHAWLSEAAWRWTTGSRSGRSASLLRRAPP